MRDIILHGEVARLAQLAEPDVVDDDADLAPRQPQVAHAALVAQVRGDHWVRALT